MRASIFKILESLDLTSEKTRTLFNSKTRDVDDLKVWKDSISGVTYIDGSYRNKETSSLETRKPDFDRTNDAQRRYKSNLKFVAGKKVGDFGCGNGDFLRLIAPHYEEVLGVELQKNT